MKKRLVLPFFFSIAFGVLPAAAQDPEPVLGAPKADIRSVAVSDNHIYLGGDFSLLQPAGSCLVALDPDTGAVDPTFPVLSGRVFDMVPDGNGGFFAGGFFQAKAAGQIYHNLVHILPGGQLDPSWDAQIDPEATIFCLAFNGAKLFISGRNDNLNTMAQLTLQGKTFPGLAALEPKTGKLLPWTPGVKGMDIRCLLATPSRLYLGGSWNIFFKSGGPRGALVCLEATTGRPVPWTVRLDDDVFGLAFSGQRLFAGGHFTKVNGNERLGLATFDLPDGKLSNWIAKGYGGQTFFLAAGDRAVYAGYRSIRAFDVQTGELLPFQSDKKSEVDCVTVGENVVYSGGFYFGIAIPNLLSLDTKTGQSRPWDVLVPGTVRCILPLGKKVMVAGEFSGINGVKRNNLARMDPVTGQFTSWSPAHKGSLHTLAFFRQWALAGTSQGVECFDKETGVPGDWAPNLSPLQGLNWDVNSILVDNNFIYLAAYNSYAQKFILSAFKYENNQPQVKGAPNISKDPTWTITLDKWVESLASLNGRLYLAGPFSQVGDEKRPGLACVNSRGKVMDWRPAPDGEVHALIAGSNRLYVGGDFCRIAGQQHFNLAAFDERGNLTAWSSGVYGSVTALALKGKTLVAGGHFIYAGGNPLFNPESRPIPAEAIGSVPGYPNPPETRAYVIGGSVKITNPQIRLMLAGFDTETGDLLNFPNASYELPSYSKLECLAIWNDRVYASGTFKWPGELFMGLLQASLKDENKP